MNPEPVYFESPTLSLEIAFRFVSARLAAQALPAYPGALPDSLDAAYARQDAAIALWPDTVVGWKVGRIPDAWLVRMGEDRLMGPVFAHQLQMLDPGQSAELRVIDGGFAAVEAEYVFVLRADADPDRIDHDQQSASELVGELRVGIELAGSPLPTINELGPAVVVSDFGNNAGIFLGPVIAGWRDQDWSRFTCETWIEGGLVGQGGALSLPGGPLAALAFALNRGARRGLPLKAGMIVSTGAATGIHDILAGQRARLVFHGCATLEAHALPSLPNRLGIRA